MARSYNEKIYFADFCIIILIIQSIALSLSISIIYFLFLIKASYMKHRLRRFSYILLYLAVEMLPFRLVAQSSEGTAGVNVRYVFRNDTLMLTGTGEMTDFTVSGNAPWKQYAGSIKAVVIAEGITSIGNCAFMDCSHLISVSISGTISSIGASAFENCARLPSVTIPQSINAVGDYAFRGCSSLTDVKVQQATPLSISQSVFDDVSGMTLIVPQNKAAAYQIANVWEDFDEIKEVIPVGPLTVQLTGGNTYVYTGDPLRPAVTVKNGDYSLTGADCTYTYSNNINAGQATITITGVLRYEGVKTVSFTIAQAAPVYTWPDKAEVEEGRSLSEARFTGGSGNGVFAFSDATVKPARSDSENTSYELVFTPADALNYASAVKSDMKVTVISTTGYPDQPFSGIIIYPNPFIGEIHLRGAAGCMLRVLNVVGVAVHTQKITTSDEILQLDNIPAGLYFFRLEKEGKTKTVKVGKR
jgi:hypothetical protein